MIIWVFDMINSNKKLVLLGGYLLVLLLSIPAFGSGCNVEVKKQITFAKGEMCWAYDGKANTFSGQFGEGQVISVRMIGLNESMSDGWEKLDPRAVGPDWLNNTEQIYSPNDDSSGASSGVLNFVAPTTGIYQFTVSPCSYWGSRIKLEICAR